MSCLRSLGVEMSGLTKFLNMSSQQAGQVPQFVDYLNVGSGELSGQEVKRKVWILGSDNDAEEWTLLSPLPSGTCLPLRRILRQVDNTIWEQISFHMLLGFLH